MSRGLWAVAALAALAATACGSSSRKGANTSANVQTSSDKYGITKTALDPRTGDATAAPPTLAPTPGMSLTGGSTAPATTGSGAALSTLGTGTTSKDPEASQTTTAAAPAATPEPAEPPKKISARHVLIQWMGSERAGKSVLRSRDQALVLAQEVHSRARSGEDLARLAVEYSDEPGAGPRGGSLGRFGKGQMVGPFEQVAFKLRVGEISEIVETPFGFHIIQRTE